MEFSHYIDPAHSLLAVRSVAPHASKAGCFTLIKLDNRVVSIQPDGSIQDRDPGTDGGYETCQISGNLATYCPDGESGDIYTFPFVVVGGLL